MRNLTIWEVGTRTELNQRLIECIKDLEKELLSHRSALDKISVDAVSVSLEDDFQRVEKRWSRTSEQIRSMNQRLELDITRWRNLAGQLEESAAWISSREPKCDELDKINLDTKVLQKILNFFVNSIIILGVDKYGQ